LDLVFDFLIVESFKQDNVERERGEAVKQETGFYVTECDGLEVAYGLVVFLVDELREEAEYNVDGKHTLHGVVQHEEAIMRGEAEARQICGEEGRDQGKDRDCE
jgi:hypothetical protein